MTTRPILILSCRDLNPISGGNRRVRALLTAIGDRAMLVQPAPPLNGVRTIPYTHTFGRAGINWGIFNFFRPANRRHVERVIGQESPAVAVLTSIWDLAALRNVGPIPFVLDAQNVERTAIAERFGEHHPFTTLVGHWERRALARMAHTFTCSPLDRESFIARYGATPDRVTVVPNGVDFAAYSGGPERPGVSDKLLSQLQGRTVLFFMGQLTYQPNTEAIRWMARFLAPALESLAPGRFAILVCGGGNIPADCSAPSMLFAGYVSDDQLRAYQARADICLAPIRTGSGTRLKILEYMASGKPVVSTAKGAEGIDYSADHEIRIVDLDSFPKALVSLADDPARMSSMGQAARQLVRTRYDWKTCIMPRWRDIIFRLANDP